jgi:cell division protein FtsB
MPNTRADRSGVESDFKRGETGVKRVLVPGLFGVAIYFAVFGGEYSLFEVRDARSRQAEETAQLQERRAVNDSLSAWADSVESDPETVERLARERFGMIKPGEVLYRFAGEGEDAPTEASDARTPSLEDAEGR